MDGCGCDGYPAPFDAHEARGDRERYHARGPDATTRMLLDMMEPEDVVGATVLDVGGGIGVIDHELLASGASRATLVDASPAYLAAAHEEAEAAGLLGRMAIVAGDFVRRAPDIEAADIVTLDRVVCCYGGAAELITTSATRAKKLYGLVLPRDRWYVRWLVRLGNLWWRLRRNPYRAFAHPHSLIEEQISAAGLRPRSAAGTFFWRVVLYERR